MGSSAPQPSGRRVQPTPTPPARGADAGVAWHDAECGSYSADLRLWEEMADEAEGKILDLGCGTGRVGLHLGRRGHQVVGVDSDTVLVAAFNQHAVGLSAHAEVGDARTFELEGEFGLVIAPMQLVQLFGGPNERVACLRCVAAHLRPGGRVALAIVEDAAAGVSWDAPAGAPLPDVREVDGWVYSSLPLETAVDGDAFVVRRLRQTVSPDGQLSDEVDEVRLRALNAATLEREALEAGLEPAGRREVGATEAHLGSTVVLLERGT